MTNENIWEDFLDVYCVFNLITEFWVTHIVLKRVYELRYKKVVWRWILQLLMIYNLFHKTNSSFVELIFMIHNLKKDLLAIENYMYMSKCKIVVLISLQNKSL